jgi:hypothetical protein
VQPLKNLWVDDEPFKLGIVWLLYTLWESESTCPLHSTQLAGSEGVPVNDFSHAITEPIGGVPSTIAESDFLSPETKPE